MHVPFTRAERIERVWLHLRERFLSDRLWLATPDACCVS
jgi:hypothetical protein